METIRFVERRKASKWPARIVLTFLVVGSIFVAYAIKNENNPKMLGLSGEIITTESNGLEEVNTTDDEKIAQAQNLNFEVKDISSSDKSMSNFVSNIHLPAIYVDGKELVDINVKVQNDYTQRFESLKSNMASAEGNYSFNVTYDTYDNMVGTKRIVSLVITQQIIDTDSNKVTSKKITAYNVDLASKTTIAQSDVLMDLLGKDYKQILKDQVKDYVISNKLTTEAKYTYEITGLENFYIKDSKFHIVFNGDSDNLIDGNKDVIDIEINKEE